MTLHRLFMAVAAVAVVCFIMLYSLPAVAQTSNGSVIGTITDPTGAVVPGVAITLVNTSTAETHSAKSDDHGSYQFVNLLPGTYKLTLEHQGFKRLQSTNVEVKTATATRIDLAMALGAVSESVEVSSQAAAIDTTSSTVGAVIEGKVVTETPLNGRNVMNLIALAPGVVPQGSSSGSVQSNQHGGTFSNPAGWGNYQIGGGMSGESAIFLDGQPLNGTMSNDPLIVPVQDVVQEFQVQSNTVSPEYGRFAGGVVVMTSKQGGNKFHGSAYEYLRNTVFDANNWMNKSQLNGAAFVGRPNLNQNQYGALLGGPIKKDKDFFFGSWEHFHLRFGDPYQVNVPTTQNMAGCYAPNPYNYVNGVQVLGPVNQTAIPVGAPTYYPLATSGNAANCPVGYYLIPSTPGNNGLTGHNEVFYTGFDPVGQYIMTHYYSAPGTPGVSLGGNTGVASGNGPAGSSYDQITVRNDYQLSASQRLFGRFTYWNAFTIAEDPFQNGYGKPGEKHQSYLADFGDTWTISPKTVADFRLSYSGMNWDSLAPSTGRDMSAYGSTMWTTLGKGQLNWNQNIDPMVPGGPLWGMFMDQTQLSFDSIIGANGSVTKIAGRHTLKFGGEYRMTHFSNWGGGAVGNASGGFLFLPIMFTDNWWSNLQVGAMTAGGTQTVIETGLRTYYGGLYAMDTFQASQKLTLNLGLRWEQPGAFEEDHDNNTVFLPNVVDPTAYYSTSAMGTVTNHALANQLGLLALVNSSDYASRYDQQLKWKLFSPRVGFAYRVTDKTVVKGGFGISLLPNNSSTSQSPIASAANSVTPANIIPANNNHTTALSNLYTTLTGYATGCTAAAPCLQQPTRRGAAGTTTYRTAQYNGNIQVQIPNYSYPYSTQWNLTVGQDLGKGTSLEVGYVASTGTHLPDNGPNNLNQWSDANIALAIADGCQTSTGATSSTCPFEGTGIMAGPKAAGTLMLPYPQYMAVNQNRAYWGHSNYNALQARLQKHFQQGSFAQASYTWSKIMSDVDSLLGFVELGTTGGSGGPQDEYNHAGERSVSSFTVPHRATISYFLALPFGKGQRLVSNVSGAADKLISGWGINGISTFQTGFPLAFTAQQTSLTTYWQAGTPRPNIVAGCNQGFSGKPSQRVKSNSWVNGACFTQPGNYSFGNAPRVSGNLHSQGIDNSDVSVVKKTAIKEGQTLEFRAEFFNIANWTRFAPPDTGVGDQTFNWIQQTANQPRIMQFAFRYNF
jgi:hypothetical protein